MSRHVGKMHADVIVKVARGVCKTCLCHCEMCLYHITSYHILFKTNKQTDVAIILQVGAIGINADVVMV